MDAALPFARKKLWLAIFGLSGLDLFLIRFLIQGQEKTFICR